MTGENYEERERRTRGFLADQRGRAINLRSKDCEVHGLGQEFLYLKAQMPHDYKESVDVKHPSDVGTICEESAKKSSSE